tara:strand:+ start:13672 stop:14280 length:609 start_codon:yes stop_codon:yes gene_type:complete
MNKEGIYNKSEYNSGDGMLTTVWGPSIWHYLHIVSFNYPINPKQIEKQKYREIILNMKHTLPCKYCRDNLTKNFQRKPLLFKHMKNRETFSKYVYELHEIINKMLNKVSGLSYEDVRERYEHFRARCTLDISKDKRNTIKVNKQKKSKKTKKTKKAKEKGCTEPLYGKKAKCVIKIVPQEEKCNTLQIDRQCIKSRTKLAKI